MRSFMCARVMLVRDSEFPATYPTGYNVLRIYCVADSSTASLQMSRSSDKIQPTYQIAAFVGANQSKCSFLLAISNVCT